MGHINDEPKCHIYIFFCHPSSLNVRRTAARHGPPAPSRRAGRGQGRRGADGLGQQERGGQSLHRYHVVQSSMGKHWTFAFTQRKKKPKTSYPKTSDMYMPLMHQSSQKPLH